MDGTPPRFSPWMAQIGCTDIEPEGLIAFCSTNKPLANTLLDFGPAYTPRSPITSSQAYGEGDRNGNRRARIQVLMHIPTLSTGLKSGNILFVRRPQS